MRTHTPGPWAYQEESDAYTHIVRTAERCFIVQLAQDTSGEAEANARLIAAAPELLNFIRWTSVYLPDALQAEANMLLAKAKTPAHTNQCVAT